MRGVILDAYLLWLTSFLKRRINLTNSVQLYNLFHLNVFRPNTPSFRRPSRSFLAQLFFLLLKFLYFLSLRPCIMSVVRPIKHARGTFVVRVENIPVTGSYFCPVPQRNRRNWLFTSYRSGCLRAVQVFGRCVCQPVRDIPYDVMNVLGEVSGCSGIVAEGDRQYLELSFITHDAARFDFLLSSPLAILTCANRKALCMNGYNIAGVPLWAVLLSLAFFRLIKGFYRHVSMPNRFEPCTILNKPVQSNDARRNLYVLGLPFDLTKCVIARILIQPYSSFTPPTEPNLLNSFLVMASCLTL